MQPTSPGSPTNKSQAASDVSTRSSDSSQSNLVSQGANLINNPQNIDHTADVTNGVQEETEVQRFLQGGDVKDLHPQPHFLIKLCKDNPTLVLGIGSAVAGILGVTFMVAAVGIGAGSFGMAAPISALLFFMGACCLGTSVACFYGALGGHALLSRQAPSPFATEEEKMSNMQIEVRKDDKLSEETKIKLLTRTMPKSNFLTPLFGERIGRKGIELGKNYKEALKDEDDRRTRAIDHLKGLPNIEEEELEEIEDKLKKARSNEEFYNTLIAKLKTHGSEQDQTIIRVGEGKKKSSAEIWNALDYLKKKEQQEGIETEDPNKATEEAMEDLLQETFKAASATQSKD